MGSVFTKRRLTSPQRPATRQWRAIHQACSAGRSSRPIDASTDSASAAPFDNALSPRLGGRTQVALLGARIQPRGWPLLPSGQRFARSERHHRPDHTRRANHWTMDRLRGASRARSYSVLTLFVSALTFGGARTNVLQGIVHLLLFVVYIALIFTP